MSLSGFEPVSVKIPSLVKALAWGIVFLVVMSTILQLDIYFSAAVPRSIVRLFYVDGESNFPTYFSGVQLLFSALLLACIARNENYRNGPHVREWVLLALGFLAMSLDEFCQLHEMLVKPVKKLLGVTHGGMFENAWVIPALVGVGAVGLYFVRFLWSLPEGLRRQFLLAAILFVGGAVGVEMPEGSYAEQHSVNNLGFVAFVTVEESLEMIGVLVFVRALLGHIATNYPSLAFTVVSPFSESSYSRS